VQVDSRDAVVMGLEDASHNGLVVDAGCALIVYHQIEAFRVVRIAIDGKRWLHALIIGVDLDDLGIESFFDALFEKVFLFGVIVAATACDQEDPDGFGGLCLSRGGKEA
jgi:hypothetical protein